MLTWRAKFTGVSVVIPRCTASLADWGGGRIAIVHIIRLRQLPRIVS